MPFYTLGLLLLTTLFIQFYAITYSSATAKDSGSNILDKLDLFLRPQHFTRHFHTYTVCNGMSNQILAHVGNIAYAISSKTPILIPDAFITDGSQDMSRPVGQTDVTPSSARYVPLSNIFDIDHLIKFIRSYGIEAKLLPYNEKMHGHLKCSWIETLSHVAPETASLVLKAFKPSALIHKMVNLALERVDEDDNLICVHHRDGEDWTKHCEKWEDIQDGVWRKNCMNEPGRTLSMDVKERMLPQSSGGSETRFTRKDSSIFYVGDSNPPRDLADSGFKVFTRGELLLGHDDVFEVENVDLNRKHHELDKSLLYAVLSRRHTACVPEFRDVCAIVDFHVCSYMPDFIGNSVSTWSALQIAQRGGAATWYNSYSIPLADFFRVFSVPIAYTYTELSEGAGKLLLKVSILSAKAIVPMSEIHVLYHGYEDFEFRLWLKERGVTIHQHEPSMKLREMINEMFRNGDESKSHLFRHAGNYFGTWQRIDLPKHINTEYILLLDCDTIVMSSFSFADFSKSLTKSIAFSAEGDEEMKEPWNAGVALLNMPYLRESYDDFLRFIKSHKHNEPYDVVMKRGSKVAAPSDQGAYLKFYAETKEFLSTKFNDKPYYLHKGKKPGEVSKVLHFHGAKPHDYLGHWLGIPCSSGVAFLCELTESKPEERPMLCPG